MIHNAALLITRSMQEITLAQWQREINIILQAAFILSKACWQPMIDAGGGSIVYLSSGSGYKGFIEEVAYNPGKHGIEGLMKCLALEGGGIQYRRELRHARRAHQHTHVECQLHRGTEKALGRSGFADAGFCYAFAAGWRRHDGTSRRRPRRWQLGCGGFAVTRPPAES